MRVDITAQGAAEAVGFGSGAGMPRAMKLGVIVCAHNDPQESGAALAAREL